MNTSINGNQKKRGRPATGERSHIAARVSEDEIKKIDEWAARHGVTRAEAIRRLVQIGLDAAE
ncbi:ribbon-helix-helix protein, CopG family [Acetobacter indonesiensis]